MVPVRLFPDLIISSARDMLSLRVPSVAKDTSGAGLLWLAYRTRIILSITVPGLYDRETMMRASSASLACSQMHPKRGSHHASASSRELNTSISSAAA